VRFVDGISPQEAAALRAALHGHEDLHE
jgi:hypothetical protein